MNRHQKIKFNSIEDFLHYLPEDEQAMVNKLRSIVRSCFPAPIEKISYNVLFYYQKSSVCYIWPSSVPWGNVKRHGVKLGFSKGYLMRDELAYLAKGNRKQVYSKTFFSLDEIDDALVKTYIYEAIRVDVEDPG